MNLFAQWFGKRNKKKTAAAIKKMNVGERVPRNDKWDKEIERLKKGQK
jgi:hypothetical protein